MILLVVIVIKKILYIFQFPMLYKSISFEKKKFHDFVPYNLYATYIIYLSNRSMIWSATRPLISNSVNQQVTTEIH